VPGRGDPRMFIKQENMFVVRHLSRRCGRRSASHSPVCGEEWLHLTRAEKAEEIVEQPAAGAGWARQRPPGGGALCRGRTALSGRPA